MTVLSILLRKSIIISFFIIIWIKTFSFFSYILSNKEIEHQVTYFSFFILCINVYLQSINQLSHFFFIQIFVTFLYKFQCINWNLQPQWQWNSEWYCWQLLTMPGVWRCANYRQHSANCSVTGHCTMFSGKCWESVRNSTYYG